MAGFEAECAVRELPLFVPPPRYLPKSAICKWEFE